ncbi:MAG: 1-acyl-sn-glycerol-3-phosphate acyltransferase, partial [Chitinophagaceae bacterium]
MIYGFVKFLMTVALRLYYRRIYVTGLENIAAKGPVIILPNHNSSLMDAAILGVLIRRPLHFFARGDVFTSNFVSKLLARFHMLPVHHHEGRKTLDQNTQSFSKAEDILLKGGIIIFFPEGSSHIDKQLKPLRKGVFRLAFNTAARKNYALDIPMIPAGITYSKPTTWRADVIVHLGTPILLSDYIPGYLSNPAATLLQLSKIAYKAMELQVPNIIDASLNDVTAGCTEIVLNDFSYHTAHWQSATRKRLEQEKAVYHSLGSASQHTREKISTTYQRYTALLNESDLKDKTLSPYFHFPGWNYLFLLSGIILFPIGFLLNALPLLVARKIS